MKKLLTIKSTKSSFDLLPKIPMRMRITSILLAGFLCHANAETSYSQSARISIEMNNATIEEVLNEIEAKSDFYFLPQIRNPTKVSERCGPNRQECDFSSLD